MILQNKLDIPLKGQVMASTLYQIMSPKARAHSLGVQVMWSLPEQGIDPAAMNMALLSAKIDNSLLAGLGTATAQMAFTIAMKYADRRYQSEDGLRRLTTQHLFTAKKADANEEQKLSSYAVNVTQVESRRRNDLMQAGIITLNPVTGTVGFEYHPGAQLRPEDYIILDKVVGKVASKVAAWTGAYTRETINKFLTRMMRKHQGFQWVVRGNSWFVPNIHYGQVSDALPENSPVEQIVNVCRILKEINTANVLQVCPVFPDPCDDSLSAHLEVRAGAKRALEMQVKEQAQTLRYLVTKEKNAKISTQQRALNELKSRADLYVRVLGAEINDLQTQIQQAQAVLDRRLTKKIALSPDEDVLQGLW